MASIRIEDLNKTFPGVQALSNINQNIASGEFFTLLGPSGCGKTTLLRAIAGLDLQTSGTIEQAGSDISDLPPAQREVLARVAQGSVLVAAILVGAEQIGIRITFLAIIAAAVFLAVAGGAAIAVSLGARSYVANLVGAHYLRQAFEVGQRLRVAGHEGRVLELNATGMILETEDGRVTLPGKLYHDEPIVLLTRTGTDG